MTAEGCDWIGEDSQGDDLPNVNFFFMFWMFDQLRKRKKHFWMNAIIGAAPPPSPSWLIWIWIVDGKMWLQLIPSPIFSFATTSLPLLPVLTFVTPENKPSSLFLCFSKVLILYLRHRPHTFFWVHYCPLVAQNTLWLQSAAVSSKESSC